MLEWWQSVILGIVEGVTEFLPISSTGHLTVAEKLMGLPDQRPVGDGLHRHHPDRRDDRVDRVLLRRHRPHRRRLVRRPAPTRRSAAPTSMRSGWAVIVGFAVTAVIALALKDLIEGPLRSLWLVVGGLLVWSVVMFSADRFGKQNRGEDTITWKDGAILGLIQCFSLVPGREPLGRHHLRCTVPGHRPGHRDPDELLPGHPDPGGRGRLPGRLRRRPTSPDPAASAGRPPSSASWCPSWSAYASIAWLLRFVATNNFTAFVIYRVVLGADHRAACCWPASSPRSDGGRWWRSWEPSRPRSAFSGLTVSRAGLGTMTWGRDTRLDDARASCCAPFVDAGGDLVDTAPAYARGEAERMLGRLLRTDVRRDDLVIATKAGFVFRDGARVVDTSRAARCWTICTGPCDAWAPTTSTCGRCTPGARRPWRRRWPPSTTR